MSNSGHGAGSQNKHNNDPIPFKKGDIVWAKVRGYSWWPAKVKNLLNYSTRFRFDLLHTINRLAMSKT